jgi:hypothetical protein
VAGWIAAEWLAFPAPGQQAEEDMAATNAVVPAPGG